MDRQRRRNVGETHAEARSRCQPRRETCRTGSSVGEDDDGGGIVSLESVEDVEDDGGRRKGKLNRVVADALTRLDDGTASTPRVHRLPRFPRISPWLFVLNHTLSGSRVYTTCNIQAEIDAYMGPVSKDHPCCRSFRRVSQIHAALANLFPAPNTTAGYISGMLATRSNVYAAAQREPRGVVAGVSQTVDPFWRSSGPPHNCFVRTILDCCCALRQAVGYKRKLGRGRCRILRVLA